MFTDTSPVLDSGRVEIFGSLSENAVPEGKRILPRNHHISVHHSTRDVVPPDRVQSKDDLEVQGLQLSLARLVYQV
jgi:hypothetical protein